MNKNVIQLPEDEYLALVDRVTALEDNVLLSARAVANRIGRHYATVRKLFQTGQIETVRVGKRLMVRPSALNRFIDAGRVDWRP